jgi:hypothetical protein
MLEHYYSTRETVCYRSAQSDLYGDWLTMSTLGESRIDPPVPVAEDLCHQLAHLQDAFVREWLFFEDDPGSASEVAALRERGLPVLAVNIRAGKLDKLVTGGPVWTYTSPGADFHGKELKRGQQHPTVRMPVGLQCRGLLSSPDKSPAGRGTCSRARSDTS